VQGVTKSSWTSIQFLSYLFDRVFGKEFTGDFQLFLPPTAVVSFCLDPIFDDESPAFLLRASGLTLKPAHELGKFGS
jgi:hypothetical protein